MLIGYVAQCADSWGSNVNSGGRRGIVVHGSWRGCSRRGIRSNPNQTIRVVIHPRKRPNTHALRGAGTPCLQKLWTEGLRVLKEQNPEFFAGE